MLKLFRNRSIFVKILLWVIVLGVGGMMAVSLIPGSASNLHLHSAHGNLAQVGDRIVTQIEANRGTARRMQSQFGGADSTFLRQVVLQQVVDQLITSRALVYEARRLGFQAPLKEIVQQLQNNPAFYPEGKFIGAELYQTVILQQTGMAAREYERELRDQILLQKLSMWVTGGVEPTQPEIEQEFRRRNDKIRLEYVLLRASDFQSRVRPTEEDLQAFYESNPDNFQLPERRAIRYVEINDAILGARIELTDQEITGLYRERRALYSEPEAARVRHILFSADGAEQKEVARKTADEVLATLRAGGDFARLAGDYSTDPNTGAEGGDWGWVERGQTMPEVEARLFALEPGSSPELVETSYGFHIVQVLERRSQRVRPQAEVRGELMDILREQKVRETSIGDARKIVAAVRDGKTLEEAAAENGWRVSEFPLLARDERLPMFGEDGSFLDAVFRLPVDTDRHPTGAVSEPVPIPTGHIVMQLKEVSAEHVGEFDEVQLQVLGHFRRQKAAELMAEAAGELAEESGKDGFAAAARRGGYKIETSGLVSRDGTVAGLGSFGDIADTAFSLAEGEISAAMTLGSNRVLFRVTERQPPDPAEMESQRAALAEDLRDEKRGLAWSAFTSSVRKRLEEEGVIEINTAAMNNLFGRR